jgi:hypothetical protein
MVVEGPGPDAGKWESVPDEALVEKRGDLALMGIVLEPLEEAVEFMLRGVLNDGLAPFHPRLDYVNSSPFDDWRDIPLFSVLCLEIFNHLAERAVHRLCQNPSCRRVFVRQHGRAAQSQHRRSGVRYCSVLCARAQAQRAYRERSRLKRDTKLQDRNQDD